MARQKSDARPRVGCKARNDEFTEFEDELLILES